MARLWRVAALASFGGMGIIAAVSQSPKKQATCKSAKDPPSPFTSWDEYVMSAAGPWGRGWDDNWDGRHPLKVEGTPVEFKGKTKHILLIRHGQYDLKDPSHGLTELGKKQSQVTGERLASIAAGVRKDHYGEHKVKYDSIISSPKLRARQTAEIICKSLPDVPRREDDPLLMEGCPCIPLPGKRDDWLERNRPSKILQQSARLESAFRAYFHRDVDHRQKPKKTSKQDGEVAQPESKPSSPTGSKPAEEHEYTILVCHMNITRYFICRALQIPPECWLRMKGDNCGITEIIIYPNGRTSLAHFADTGHLPIEMHTFH